MNALEDHEMPVCVVDEGRRLKAEADSDGIS